MLLDRLVEALDENGLDYAIVGGYAVALHGAVRGTVDIDLVICLNESDFLKAEKTLKEIGLESRLPIQAKQVFQFRKEYIKNRNLIAWNFYNPANPVEIVDILLTHDRRKIKVKRIRAGRMAYKVAAIDDLIQMKLESGRPQDLNDVAALKELAK